MENMFYCVYGLPETVFFRGPEKEIPLRVLLPAFTKLARHYNCRQKDITSYDIVDEPSVEEAFNGSGGLKTADLWVWNAEAKSLSLYRSRPLTRQMEQVEMVNSLLQNQTADFNPAEVEWEYIRFLPLEYLGDKAYWIALYSSLVAEAKKTNTSVDCTKRVVIVKQGETYRVLSGHAKIASNVVRGYEGVSGIFGEV